MLLYNIEDFEDFQFLFGLDYHGNGVKSRRNRILLQHLKTPALIRYCREHKDWSLLHVRSMAELKQVTLECIRQTGNADTDLPNKVILIGKTYWSAQYRTDSNEGLCEDFDKRSVRYVNIKSNRTYKMKAGKFLTAIIKESEIGKVLCEQVINWLSEEFSQDWQTYTLRKTPEVELHVDDNFELIYDYEACRDFNGCSCMVGKDRHRFYEDSVDAKAAYLLDKDGYVLARAIIFMDVRDQYGKKWRLCERQYSKESNEVLKRVLVDALIKEGHIDGFKQIGAGCSESRAFVAIDGSSLSDRQFSIRCSLRTDQVLSYQDSFKYYDYDSDVAYNYYDAPHDYCLDTTDYNLDGDFDDDDDDNEPTGEYDDYHDYYCDEVTSCHYHGNQIYVDTQNLEDFIWVEEAGYVHRDDIVVCTHCGRTLVKDDATYNSEVQRHFCNDTCENDYIKANFHYSEYDDDYYRNAEDLTTINMWEDTTQSYREVSISRRSMDWLISNREAFGSGDIWFIFDGSLKTA